MARHLVLLMSVAALAVTSCSSDSSPSAATSAVTTPLPTQPPTTDTTPPPTDPANTEPPASNVLDARGIVEALASDRFAGRDNGTEGSLLAQRLLIDQLADFAEPAFPELTGDDGFLQPFDEGVNILAVIPGGDLADEYVVIGAHYDHLGPDCASDDPADTICNGATDNATGVAAAVSVARAIAEAGTPRRSVLIGLWDAEEDGLLGSAFYASEPLVPAAQTIAYINFDIQGANLVPSLANLTIAVGAETGGAAFVAAVDRASTNSLLDTLQLSLLFGQGRSDHVNFTNMQVPSIFFTDANSACYHTVQDDVTAVDFDKLDQQIATATALALDMVATDDVPVFDAAAPLASYEDAASMLAVVSSAQPDFNRFTPETQAIANQYIVDLQAIVDAGPEAFGDASVGTLLIGAVAIVTALTEGVCDDLDP